jgi:hypothetical protein
MKLVIRRDAGRLGAHDDVHEHEPARQARGRGLTRGGQRGDPAKRGADEHRRPVERVQQTHEVAEKRFQPVVLTRLPFAVAVATGIKDERLATVPDQPTGRALPRVTSLAAADAKYNRLLARVSAPALTRQLDRVALPVKGLGRRNHPPTLEPGKPGQSRPRPSPAFAQAA